MLRAVKSLTTSNSGAKRPKFGATNTTRRDHTLKTLRGSLIGTDVLDTRVYKPVYTVYARIRYALPPTGHRRWRRPEPLPAEWVFSEGDDRPEDHRGFGNICPQLVGEYDAISLSQWQEVVDNTVGEDCLFLNVWVPAGSKQPVGGWPVQFMIPGCGTQCGHGMQQNVLDPIDIFRKHRTEPRVIVSACYRVGIFGFMASEDLMVDGMNPATHISDSAGNFGLWDIRMALEWTYDHINLFGGNPNNIALGGSGMITALQLHYDAFQPPENRIIRRAFLFSGAVGVQPEHANAEKPTRQLDEVCAQLLIDKDLPPYDKIRQLRAVTAEKLLDVVQILEAEFKPVTDGKAGFVPVWLMSSIWNGELGRRLKQRHVQVIVGDPTGEKSFYEYSLRTTGSRRIPNRDALLHKLKYSFPADICQELVQRYSRNITDWTSVYSEIMADMQCHAVVRGFTQCLFQGGMTTKDVLRYQISWRSKGLDDWIDSETGVSHLVDLPIWWCSGWRAGFSKKDKHDVLAFISPFHRLLKENASVSCGWGTAEEFDVRMLSADGATMIVEDPLWVRKLDIWNLIRDVQKQRSAPKAEQTSGDIAEITWPLPPRATPSVG